MAKKTKPTIQRFNYRLNQLHVTNLKGIKDFTLTFDKEKLVTGIVGINGSGKSTLIHALACAFKPVGKATSKDFNRLSHFFTPNKDASWEGSEFEIDFEYEELTIKPNTEPVKKTVNHKEVYSKKQGKVVSRWLPIYARRHARESAYIGLHDLATLNEDKNAGRYKEYETEDLAHEAADKIKEDLIYILGRDYTRLTTCLIQQKDKVHTLFGLSHNGVEYSEHSMGAGEKRLLKILSALHNPKLAKGGLLLIDEIDVLLHGMAFKRLIERIVKRANENKIEVIFSTHRETIVDFKNDVLIYGILNTGKGVIPMPHTHPQVMQQLTGLRSAPIDIYVEDDLAATVIDTLLYQKHGTQLVDVTRFGTWSNAFAILAGKILMESELSETLCVLDGDVCKSIEEKKSECQRHLNGDDKADLREGMLSHIVEFKLKHLAPEGCSGSPEYNLKLLFESIVSQDARINDLQRYSREIQGLEDWHCYFEHLSNDSGIRTAKDKVLEAISETEIWDDYVSEISNWLDDKLKKYKHHEEKLEVTA
jgi:AAA15 family ATPase/GTPase